MPKFVLIMAVLTVAFILLATFWDRLFGKGVISTMITTRSNQAASLLPLYSAVGNLILNFGTLEMMVTACLQEALPAEYERNRDKPLNEKLERLEEQFAKHPEQREGFVAMRNKLDPIRELRNHVAHGYLQVSIRTEGEQPRVGIVQAKDLAAPFSLETRYLTLEDFRQPLADLDWVIAEFERLTGFNAK